LRLLNEYGLSYNRALIGVERNNHGHAVLLGLKEDCHYPNIYAEKEERKKIITNVNRIKPEPRLGWSTTKVSKVQMLEHLKIGVEGVAEEDEHTFEPDYTVNDLTFLSECLTFQRDGDKLGAISGKNDDVVIATAIAYQMYLHRRKKLTLGDLSGVHIGTQREYTI